MGTRKLMRYALYKVDSAWRTLPPEEKALHKKELCDFFKAAQSVDAYTYSTVGLRADSDFLVWTVADSPDRIQQFQAQINATALGRSLQQSYSYLAMTRESKYLKEHKHEGQEADSPAGPVGSKYLFIYPMDKQRAWYRLPFEDRRRIMGEHFKIGHKYPGVKIHTGYSFGIDDQEFVVAFESDAVDDFLELVMELRESESSSYTARDVPIFTCVKMPIEAILDQLDGEAAQG